jgi:hypothetical protein
MPQNDVDIVKDKVLALIQNDRDIATAISEAIMLKKRDWLANFVETVAKGIPEVRFSTQTLLTVIDWIYQFWDKRPYI